LKASPAEHVAGRDGLCAREGAFLAGVLGPARIGPGGITDTEATSIGSSGLLLHNSMKWLKRKIGAVSFVAALRPNRFRLTIAMKRTKFAGCFASAAIWGLGISWTVLKRFAQPPNI
jgi:hypothetical protein